MRQIFFQRGNTHATLTMHAPVCNEPFIGYAAGGEVPGKVEAAGTITAIGVVLDTAPGSGKSLAFTLKKNGTDTALTFTIADLATTGRDIDAGHAVTVAVGDTLSIKVVPTGTPTIGSWTHTWAEFTSDTIKESWYSGVLSSGISTSATRYNGLFNPTDWQTTNLYPSLVPLAGTINSIRWELSGSPGVGKSYTFAVYKNGVKQDGTGGTPNTVSTISDAATSVVMSTAVTVSPGDTIYLECVPAGTPTSRTVRTSCRFTADSDGRSIWCGTWADDLHQTATEYSYPHGTGGLTSWNSSETPHRSAYFNGPNGFSLRDFRCVLTAAPGSGKNYTFTVRRNSSSPALTPTITVADANTSGSDGTGSVAITNGDYFSVQSIPSGTPSLAQVMWGLVQIDEAFVGTGIVPFIHHYKQQGIM